MADSAETTIWTSKTSAVDMKAERDVQDMIDTADKLTSMSVASPKDIQGEKDTPDTTDAIHTEHARSSSKSATCHPIPSPKTMATAIKEHPSQNRPNQYPIKPSLEELPPELLACILQQLSSPDQLYSAVNTSRAIYRSFRLSKVSILKSILERAIHPAVLPLAILICEKGGDKDGIPARGDGYLHRDYRDGEKVRKEGEPSEGAIRYSYFRRKVREMTEIIDTGHYSHLSRQRLSGLKILVPLCRLYSLVDFFIEDYCASTSEQVRRLVKERYEFGDDDDDDDDGSIEQHFRKFEIRKNNLSANEYARLQRAFFWFEIHRRFFSDLEHYRESGWSEEEKRNANFRRTTLFWHMKATERKELWSVTAYLIRRMNVSYSTLDETLIFNLLPEVGDRLAVGDNDSDGDNDHCSSGADSNSEVGDDRDSATNSDKVGGDGGAVNDEKGVPGGSETGNDSGRENGSGIDFDCRKGDDYISKIGFGIVENRSERDTKGDKASCDGEMGYGRENNAISAKMKSKIEDGDDGESGNHFIGGDGKNKDIGDTKKVGNSGRGDSDRDGNSSESAINNSEIYNDTEDSSSSNSGRSFDNWLTNLVPVLFTERDLAAAVKSAASNVLGSSLVKYHASGCVHEDMIDWKEATQETVGIMKLPYSCLGGHLALQETVRKRKKATLLIEAGLPFCRLMFAEYNHPRIRMALIYQYCISRQHWELDDKGMYSNGDENTVGSNEGNEAAIRQIPKGPDLLYHDDVLSSSYSPLWPVSDHDGRLSKIHTWSADDIEQVASHARRHVGYHIWDDGRLNGYRCGIKKAISSINWERDCHPSISDFEICWHCLDLGILPHVVQMMTNHLAETLRPHQPGMEDLLRQWDYLPLP